MRVRRDLHLLAVTAFAILATSCDDTSLDPEPPLPGDALIIFDSPQNAEGAVLLTVRGPTAPDLRPGSAAYALYTRTLEDGAARAVVVGTVTDGVLLKFSIPDVARLAEYELELHQVSSTGSNLRADLSGYVVSLELAAAQAP